MAEFEAAIVRELFRCLESNASYFKQNLILQGDAYGPLVSLRVSGVDAAAPAGDATSNTTKASTAAVPLCELVSFMPRHIIGHLVRSADTSSHAYVCECLVVLHRVVMLDLSAVNSVTRDASFARRFMDMALMTLIQSLYRLWDDTNTRTPYAVTFRMIHVTLLLVRHFVRAEFAPVIKPREERLYVEAMVGHPDLIIFVESIFDFIAICIERIQYSAEQAQKQSDGPTGDERFREDDLVYLYDALEAAVYVCSSGDAVAMLLSLEATSPRSVIERCNTLLQVEPPSVIYCACLKLLHVLFAFEDPSFLDEVSTMNDSKSAIQRIIQRLSSLLDKSVADNTYNSLHAVQAMRVLEILSDDSNFKQKVIRVGRMTFLKFLSLPTEKIVSIFEGGESPEKTIFATLFRILAGLHCFNPEFQKPEEKDSFVRETLHAYKVPALRKLVNWDNFVNTLTVVPEKIIAMDKLAAWLMTNEELTLVIEFRKVIKQELAILRKAEEDQ